MIYSNVPIHPKFESIKELLKFLLLLLLDTHMTLSPELEKNAPAFPHLVSVSVIIPVFNQQRKITHSIEKIKQVVESYFREYELIVVNDGSTDDTLTTLKYLESTYEKKHLRILSYTPNRGKGYAVRQGILHSSGEVVMFLDGDLDISPDLIKDYVEKLDTADLVIASKRHPRSSVKVPTSRIIMSRAFNLIVNLATGIHQSDTQAGFKVGKGEVMRSIFENVNVNRYAFDIELFTIASVLRYRIQEMPVIMRIDRRFKIKDIIRMAIDLSKIAYKYRISRHYQNILLKSEKIKEVSSVMTI
jgi:dolichol-phosphate mannosyltransferase